MASYIFYGYWDWKFLTLIFICTLQTFFLASLISSTDLKKFYLWTSISFNLLILGFFKYYNFFFSELTLLFQSLGYEGSYTTLKIILPVGISFYIFQSLTYVIDVYKEKIPTEKSFLNYSTFVAFFPQLVAGPIERASNLLPQFAMITTINSLNLWQGIKLIIFGLFLKLVIADGLAPSVDSIFNDYKLLDSGTLALGAIYFSAQIYGDFCGYSTIAIGIAKCLGFNLMNNFDTPYLSSSIQEFWRRWHISLSSFFRDYVYIPLGGSRVGERKTFLNTLITFTTSGLWHGANWTFICWGLFHGITLVLQRFFNKKNLFSFMDSSTSIGKFLSWVVTILIVINFWIFFRSDSIDMALNYISLMYQNINIPQAYTNVSYLLIILAAIDLLWNGNTRLERPIFKSAVLELFTLSCMLAGIFFFAFFHGTDNAFIYFQF
jgi:D-alanyl-lipoteichoic acid acyltransferase DltB (MBOAT superfamily)